MSCSTRVAERGEADIIEDVAFPVPVAMICEMLGVPPEDVDRFRAWSAVAARSLDPDFVLAPEEVARREQSFVEFREYFARSDRRATQESQGRPAQPRSSSRRTRATS